MARVGYCLFSRQLHTGLVAAAIAGLLAGGVPEFVMGIP
jgi:tetrahydromethanopterin S-methyltransferase subunit F